MVAENAQHVVVMYAARSGGERPGERALFARPMHPYTRGLLESVPRGKPTANRRLRTIEGMVPDLRALPAGCRFADRCPLRIEKCVLEEPPAAEVAPGRISRCWRPEDVQPEVPS